MTDVDPSVAIPGWYKVTFEQVSATTHPEYYRSDGPAVRPEQVPDEHWTADSGEGEEDSVRSQYEHLLRLVERGELIRNPQLHVGETPKTTAQNP